MASPSGKVVKVLVSAGQSVTAGQTLLVLEDMKMEHTVCAIVDGRLTYLHAAEAGQVDAGARLAVLTADP